MEEVVRSSSPRSTERNGPGGPEEKGVGEGHQEREG